LKEIDVRAPEKKDEKDRSPNVLPSSWRWGDLDKERREIGLCLE